MLIFIVFCWLLTAAYLVLIFAWKRGWDLQTHFEPAAEHPPPTRISIIIPARNEADNIAACIGSIVRNDYPAGLYEIIVVDDHSADNTAGVVGSLNIPNLKCLRLSDFVQPDEVVTAPKKKALAVGISQGTGQLILTTDADCILPPLWLSQMSEIYQRENPVMIVAPVAFTANGRIVELFQSLDFLSMQGVTAAAHRLKLGGMSNGANLGFSRAAFSSVGGYEGIDHLASGDDFLLMMKLRQRYPDRIAYLKSEDAIVSTTPQPDWNSFLQQRIRWASKSGKYDDRKLTAILALIYLFNLLFPVLAVLGFWDRGFWLLGAGLLLVKGAAEFWFVLPVAAFFKKEKELRWFLLFQPLHIGYVVLAGFLGLIGVYQWKGRKLR